MAKNRGLARKYARERLSVEAYLKQRQRDGQEPWSGRAEDLVPFDRPDFLVRGTDERELGIEVTEVVGDVPARAANYEAELASGLREALARGGGGGLVRFSASHRPPFEDRAFREALVQRLDIDIRSAGGLLALVARLPGRRWAFRWAGHGAGHPSDKAGVVEVGLEFSPLASRTDWFLNVTAPFDTGPAPSLTALEAMVLTAVTDKVAKATAFRATSAGLHVLILNQGKPMLPSAALRATVAAAIASTLVTEVWLLNRNLTTRDADPPEPYLVQLA